jgi:hypothetical protein
MTIAESNWFNKEQIVRAFGVPAHILADPDRTAAPRYWSLCMTSENHGTVGKAGDVFSHAPGKHERVLVVEVPTPANAPIDRVDLRVLTGTGVARTPMGELVFGASTQHAVGKTAEETVEVPAQWLRNLAQLRPEAYSHDGLMAVTRAFCDTADDYSAGILPVFAIAPAATSASTAHPNWLDYDPAKDILTIYGVKYSSELFSGLGLGPVGMSFTILAREDGALTLCRGPVTAQADPTVLTDERIEQIWDETVTADAETLKEVRLRFARAVARNVAAQIDQVAVPEGWKLVPVEPTLDMVTKGFESAPDEFFSPGENWDTYAAMTGCQKAAYRARLCYAAMLAAAPAVPAQAAPLPVQAAPAPAERIECWSHNEEDFSAKSLGELVDTHELQPGATVWAGEAVHPEPSSLFSTDWVIENMGEAAYDIAGEHGGEDYPNVSDEQVAELEALVVGWITKCAPPTFWTVKNVRAYVLTAKDCGGQASTSGERQEGGAA